MRAQTEKAVPKSDEEVFIAFRNGLSFTPSRRRGARSFFRRKMFHVEHFVPDLIKTGADLHTKNSIPLRDSEPRQEERYFTP